MPRIFGILVLALSILLFPPSVLALISNNAVPGDSTYPVKIKLEEGIVFLTSFNPRTKIWFSVTRSDRRFQEASILLNRGEAAENILTELVVQTDVAAKEISQISDQNKKQEFINSLQQSIQKYDDGLSSIQQRQIAQAPVSTSIITSPVPTSAPTSVPQQTPVVSAKPQPTIVPAPTSPAPVSQPVSQPITITPPEAKNGEEIKKAREKLEEIKKKLSHPQNPPLTIIEDKGEKGSNTTDEDEGDRVNRGNKNEKINR
ncbi:MAG: hypothetical protein HYW45_03065 [Candidatus Daviesbacteria bacterium]|nr:MAG: hypothetical protein HYW45_03065 [Candidatus Daviesbacteria bacterium]